MYMKHAFVSYLGTDSFLPGVLALNESLKLFKHSSALVVLLSEKHVSDRTIDIIKSNEITFKKVEEIQNPNIILDDVRGYTFTYTKLRIFELYEYETIVYLDADSIVCGNLDELFTKPHMSAVISGGLAHPSWRDLNSGLLVLKPNIELFKKMMEKISTTYSSDGGDQGFLHNFFPEWPINTHLHLEHRYNVPVSYLNHYCGYCGFGFSYKNQLLATNVSILHYWGANKPWNISPDTISADSSTELQAINLWWDLYSLSQYSPV